MVKNIMTVWKLKRALLLIQSDLRVKRLTSNHVLFLWQSVEPDILEMSEPSKHVSPFGRMHKTFVNNIQCLFDATQKVASLKQPNHDMVLHLAEARAAAAVRRFLVAHILEELNKKLDTYTWSWFRSTFRFLSCS